MGPEATGFLVGVLVSVPALYFISARAFKAGGKKAFEHGFKEGMKAGMKEGLTAQIEKMTGMKLDLNGNKVEVHAIDMNDKESIKENFQRIKDMLNK